MIKRDKIKTITDATIDRMTHELIPVVDKFLLKNAILLQDGETKSFDLQYQIENNFNLADEDQMVYDYGKMIQSRMMVAEKLAAMYTKNGWKAEAMDIASEEWSVTPKILFSVETPYKKEKDKK